MNKFPMNEDEIRQWDGKVGNVSYGDPRTGTTAIPVWLTLHGMIQVFDDHLTVTPVPRLGMTAEPYPGGGVVPFAQVKSIEP